MLDIATDSDDIGRWYTGISVQEMTGNLAKNLGYDGGNGVVVASVEDGSPGDTCGLKPGDIIVRVDGYTVTSAEDVTNIFKGSIPGEKVRLTVAREGETRELILVIGSF